mmetsp:Transcript_13094/g.14512  ORF Transcript_13094/g.14512 Transcript_13094/m.14512 type:complete len:91 (+) Transcript_13094:476-748(+)
MSIRAFQSKSRENYGWLIQNIFPENKTVHSLELIISWNCFGSALLRACPSCNPAGCTQMMSSTSPPSINPTTIPNTPTLPTTVHRTLSLS